MNALGKGSQLLVDQPVLCCRHAVQRGETKKSAGKRSQEKCNRCERKIAAMGRTWDGFPNEHLGLNADFEKGTAACECYDALAKAKRHVVDCCAPPEVSSTVKEIGFNEVKAA